jgi:hypothetical protein
MPSGGKYAGGRYALFQKADGSFWLALWNEQILNAYRGDNHDVHVAPVPVTVSFATPVGKVVEYDPIDHGTTPVASGSGGSFALRLPAHPVLLRIDTK